MSSCQRLFTIAAEIQCAIKAVNIYRVEYRLQAPSDRLPAALVAQQILYTFPCSRIDQVVLADLQ